MAAAVVLWLGFTLAGDWFTRTPSAVSVEANEVPEGVPSSAQRVPLLILLDGTTLRVGDAQVDMHARLGEAPGDQPPRVSRGPFGDRLTREYERQGTQFFVVCERTEPGGPVRVSRIYLPR